MGNSSADPRVLRSLSLSIVTTRRASALPILVIAIAGCASTHPSSGVSIVFSNSPVHPGEVASFYIENRSKVVLEYWGCGMYLEKLNPGGAFQVADGPWGCQLLMDTVRANGRRADGVRVPADAQPGIYRVAIEFHPRGGGDVFRFASGPFEVTSPEAGS